MDARRNVHGEHPQQKTTKNMKSWMTGRAALEEVSNHEDHRPHDKNADHVSSEGVRGFQHGSIRRRRQVGEQA